MRRLLVAGSILVAVSGCAVVKTTDVTDAAFKRHQSVAVLGWPVYSRVTDREPGAATQLARTPLDRRSEFQPAELLVWPGEGESVAGEDWQR